MRVLLVSDSHGRNQNMEKVIRKVSPIDLLGLKYNFQHREAHVQQYPRLIFLDILASQEMGRNE